VLIQVSLKKDYQMIVLQTQTDDMTGGHCVAARSRIPLSYRRKAKNRAGKILENARLSFFDAAIVAPLCQTCVNYRTFWHLFKLLNEKKHI
jgi:hypothetical protein